MEISRSPEPIQPNFNNAKNRFKTFPGPLPKHSIVSKIMRKKKRKQVVKKRIDIVIITRSEAGVPVVQEEGRFDIHNLNIHTIGLVAVGH